MTDTSPARFLWNISDMFQNPRPAAPDFRMFQLFTTCFRVRDQQRRPYRQNRRVVEHKGLLNRFGVFKRYPITFLLLRCSTSSGVC